MAGTAQPDYIDDLLGLTSSTEPSSANGTGSTVPVVGIEVSRVPDCTGRREKEKEEGKNDRIEPLNWLQLVCLFSPLLFAGAGYWRLSVREEVLFRHRLSQRKRATIWEHDSN